MISLALTDIKEFTSQLLLKDTFDNFCFIEGEIVTFNTFHIDGFIQKDFFNSGTELPEYSRWKNVREICLHIIRGKRTPLSFRFVFSLTPKNIERLIARNSPSIRPEEVRGLYLNLRFDGTQLTCVTGTSLRTFTMDKSLEHIWDETAERFLRQKNIPFERM